MGNQTGLFELQQAWFGDNQSTKQAREDPLDRYVDAMQAGGERSKGFYLIQIPEALHVVLLA